MCWALCAKSIQENATTQLSIKTRVILSDNHNTSSLLKSLRSKNHLMPIYILFVESRCGAGQPFHLDPRRCINYYL